MLKWNRTSQTSKNKVFPFLDKSKNSEKELSKYLLSQKDVIFFFRYVNRHNLREKALELLQAKMDTARLH